MRIWLFFYGPPEVHNCLARLCLRPKRNFYIKVEFLLHQTVISVQLLNNRAFQPLKAKTNGHSKHSREFHSLFLSPALSLSLSLSLLDSKTLSAIRKFLFSPSFKNILGSSHLHVVAHLRPQPNLDGSDGFCLLSFFFFFFFFFFFYCYNLINFKIVFLSLYSDNLIMLEFRDAWEKDCCICSVCSVA